MEVSCMFVTVSGSVSAYSYYYASPDSSHGSGGRACVL